MRLMKDERLVEAFNAWEELSQTPDTIIAYHSRLKAIKDHELSLIYAEEKGIEKGIEEGLEKGKQEGIEEGIKKVAKNMIEKGASNEDIAEFTELSIEEVERIRKKMQ